MKTRTAIANCFLWGHAILAQTATPAPAEIAKDSAAQVEALVLSEELARAQADLANAQVALAVTKLRIRQQSAREEICKTAQIPLDECSIYPKVEPVSGERKWYIRREEKPKPESKPEVESKKGK